MVEAIRIDTEQTEAYRLYLKDLLTEYVEKTNSPWGTEVLNNFSRMIGDFWLVKSRSIDIEHLFELFAKQAD
jgi:glutamate synthase (NADPH/NADH) large chain